MSSDPLYPSWIGSIRFIASHSLCLLTVLPCSAWHKVTRVYGCTFFTSQGALYQPPLKRHPQDSDHVLLHRKCESRVKAGTQQPVHRGLWLCLWYQKTVGREEGRRKREGKKEEEKEGGNWRKVIEVRKSHLQQWKIKQSKTKAWGIYAINPLWNGFTSKRSQDRSTHRAKGMVHPDTNLDQNHENILDWKYGS